MKEYNGLPSVREVLEQVTEGITVWVHQSCWPEIPIYRINKQKIEGFFKDNPYMEKMFVAKARFVDSGDYLIIIH